MISSCVGFLFLLCPSVWVNQYGVTVAESVAEVRAAFIRKVYRVLCKRLYCESTSMVIHDDGHTIQTEAVRLGHPTLSKIVGDTARVHQFSGNVKDLEWND